MKLTLKEIAAAVGGELSGDPDGFVASVSTDSRTLAAGSLFFALRGDNFDGHDHVWEAFAKGAACAVVERDWQTGDNSGRRVENACRFERSEESSHVRRPSLIRVAGTHRALLKLAEYYRGLHDIRAVAVTGSVGKTTTKDMIASVLSQKYVTLKTPGNRNNHIGLPLTLLTLDESHEAAVLEMGMNHSGEIRELSMCARPSVCVITNIGDSHIEHLGSREGILEAKLEILDGTKMKAGTLVLNGDDPLLRGLRDKYPDAVYCTAGEPSHPSARCGSEPARHSERAWDKAAPPLLNRNSCWETVPNATVKNPTNKGGAVMKHPASGAFHAPVPRSGTSDRHQGRKPESSGFPAHKKAGRGEESTPLPGPVHSAVYAAAVTPLGLEGTTFTLHINEAARAVRVPRPGLHMVSNALLAAAVGQIYGLTIEQIAAGIEAFTPTERRFEVIAANGMQIIDDAYNANPTSMRAAIDILAGIKDAKRRVCVLGDMFELGGHSERLHREIGEYIADAGIDLVIAVGKNAKRYMSAGSYWFEDNEAFICKWKEILQPGDAVLVKASNGMRFKEIISAITQGVIA